MSKEDPKTPLDHVNTALLQLKEMRHYSKTNVEHLTTQWLLFDGELKKLGQSAPFEALVEKQGSVHDALEAVIADLEALATELQPPPEDAAPA